MERVYTEETTMLHRTEVQLKRALNLLDGAAIINNDADIDRSIAGVRKALEGALVLTDDKSSNAQFSSLVKKRNADMNSSTSKTPELCNVITTNLGIHAETPIFIETILKRVVPVDDRERLQEVKEVVAGIDIPIFVGYKTEGKTSVTSLNEPLLYLTAEDIVNAIKDVPQTFINENAYIDIPVDRKVELIKEFWDDTLSEEECVNLYSVVGYVNQHGYSSVIPRLTFCRHVSMKLKALLESGLSFDSSTPHCLFTVQFRRFFVS